MTNYRIVKVQSRLRMLARLLWIQFFVLIVLQNSAGQTAGSNMPANRYLSLGVSSDAFTGMELGYSQNVGILKNNDMQVYARLSLPLLLSVKDKSLDSWDLSLGVNSGFIGSGRFGVVADMQVFILHHTQVLGTFMPLGVDLSFTPAYHTKNGYLGFQFRWNQTVATHVSHSDYVKNAFDDLYTKDNQLLSNSPRDGWYGNLGSHLGFGIEGGRTVGLRSFVHIDMGILSFSSPYTGLLDAMSMGQVPIYMDLRCRYKL